MLKSHEKGIDCPLVQQNLVPAHLLDAPRDSVAVQRTHGLESAQHHACVSRSSCASSSIFLKGGASCRGISMQSSSGPARQARLWLRGLRQRAWRAPLLNGTSLVAPV